MLGENRSIFFSGTVVQEDELETVEGLEGLPHDTVQPLAQKTGVVIVRDDYAHLEFLVHLFKTNPRILRGSLRLFRTSHAEMTSMFS
jgi:hypothetical protein